MRLRWSLGSQRDLRQIPDYIRNERPSAAGKVLAGIRQGCQSLTCAPLRGRPGNRKGTRELILPPLPYVIVYRVRDSYIQIVRIWHGAQNR